MPVIFHAVLSWLHQGEDVDTELERVSSGSALPPVRGWGQPYRRKARSG
jgi:hypothetical protein